MDFKMAVGMSLMYDVVDLVSKYIMFLFLG